MLPAKDIFEAALMLTPVERAKLVVEISATLEGVQLSEGWEDEITRRVNELDEGCVDTIPGEQVFANLDRRFCGK